MSAGSAQGTESSGPGRAAGGTKGTAATGPGCSRWILRTAQRVVVRDGGTEIHGYAVSMARDGELVDVVWAVASGRHRRRAFHVDRVFLPSKDRPWAGFPIWRGQPETAGGASLDKPARLPQ